MIELGTPVVGYRVWRGSGDGLLSLNGRRWAAGDLEAECLKRSACAHSVPDADCGCGFYALHRVPDLPSVDHVVGAVLMWGRLEVHWDGLRASRARPLALVSPTVGPSGKLAHLARRYGVAVVPREHLSAVAQEHGAVVPLGARPTSPSRLLDDIARTIHVRDWDGLSPSGSLLDTGSVSLLAELTSRTPAPPEAELAGLWFQRLLVNVAVHQHEAVDEASATSARESEFPWETVAPFTEITRGFGVIALPGRAGATRSWRQQVQLIENSLRHLVRCAAATRDEVLARVATSAHELVNPVDRASRSIVLEEGLRPEPAVWSELRHAHSSGRVSELARRLAHERIEELNPPESEDHSDALATRHCVQACALLLLEELPKPMVVRLLKNPVSGRFLEAALIRLGDNAAAPALRLLERQSAPLALEACARAAGARALPELTRLLSDHDNAWAFATSNYLRRLLGQERFTDVAEAALRSGADPAHQVGLCALLPVQTAGACAGAVLKAAMDNTAAPDAAQRAWNCASGHPELLRFLPSDLILRALRNRDMFASTATALIAHRPESATTEVLRSYWHSPSMRTFELYDLLVAAGRRLDAERTAALEQVVGPLHEVLRLRQMAAALTAAEDSETLFSHAARVAGNPNAPRHLVRLSDWICQGQRAVGVSERRQFLMTLA